MAVVGAALGAFVYLQRTEPSWYARLWYPLQVPDDRPRTYAQQQQLDPALLAAVIETESKFNPERALERRRCRPHAADTRRPRRGSR